MYHHQKLVAIEMKLYLQDNIGAVYPQTIERHVSG